MNIQTKLDINDDIFYLAQNRVQHEKVQNINANIVGNKILVGSFETHILYVTNFNVTVNDKNAFSTKQELLDSL